MFGALTLRPEARCFHCRWLALDTNLRTMAGACRRASASGSAAAGGSENVNLLPLPAYAPELNPVEQVWAYLRANFLSHRVWNSYGAMLACDVQWPIACGSWCRLTPPRRQRCDGQRVASPPRRSPAPARPRGWARRAIATLMHPLIPLQLHRGKRIAWTAWS